MSYRTNFDTTPGLCSGRRNCANDHSKRTSITQRTRGASELHQPESRSLRPAAVSIPVRCPPRSPRCGADGDRTCRSAAAAKKLSPRLLACSASSANSVAGITWAKGNFRNGRVVKVLVLGCARPRIRTSYRTCAAPSSIGRRHRLLPLHLGEAASPPLVPAWQARGPGAPQRRRASPRTLRRAPRSLLEQVHGRQRRRGAGPASSPSIDGTRRGHRLPRLGDHVARTQRSRAPPAHA